MIVPAAPLEARSLAKSPVAPAPDVVIVADPSLICEPAPSALTPYAPRPVAGDTPPEVAIVVIVEPVAEIAPPSAA